jgi:hypothetical protein
MEGVPAVPDREDVPQVDAREEVIPEAREHVLEPSPDDPRSECRSHSCESSADPELRPRVGGLGSWSRYRHQGAFREIQGSISVTCRLDNRALPLPQWQRQSLVTG